MKKILVLLVVVAVVAADHHMGPYKKKGKKHDDDDDDHDHHQEEYDALQKRLDLVTARLHHLDDELDKRFDPELKKKALSLEYRVEVLEEPNCDKDHFDCGPNDHECVSRLLVCDGVKDCRNGGDESHCHLPTKKGDHFEGDKVYENCSETIPEKFDFTITSVKVHSDYKAFPIIRAVLHFAESTHEEDHEISLPTVGYYRYHNHKLVLKSPQGKGLGLLCDFDGHNDDRCVGEILNEGSLTVCAKYIFHRKDDHDDHDDDHHDDDHKDDDHHKDKDHKDNHHKKH